jgi:hypothetical protein
MNNPLRVMPPAVAAAEAAATTRVGYRHARRRMAGTPGQNGIGWEATDDDGVDR